MKCVRPNARQILILAKFIGAFALFERNSLKLHTIRNIIVRAHVFITGALSIVIYIKLPACLFKALSVEKPISNTCVYYRRFEYCHFYQTDM